MDGFIRIFRNYIIMLVLCAVYSLPASASKPTADLIKLHTPVTLTVEEKAFIGALAPIKVRALKNEPPLSVYDRKTGQYRGVSIDVFQFIADEIGLNFTFVEGLGFSVDATLKQLEQGQIDVLLPASLLTEYSKLGVFSDTYYEGFYSAIARKEDHIRLQNTEELAEYRVCSANSASVVPHLQSVVPIEQMQTYVHGNVYNALRLKKIDIAVLNKSVFAEDRINHALFDLEDIYTLHEFPRAYGFLFRKTAEIEQLMTIFNRFIAALDTSESVQSHESSKERLIEKYIEQKNHEHLLLVVIGAAALLLIILFIAHRSRQQMLAQLAKSHEHIVKQHQTLQEANIQLKHLNRIDNLTGLANRGYFDERLAFECARHRRTGLSLSILMIDIDFFKSINDHYGHVAGDVYLQKVAGVLTTSMLRSSDFVARYGGEEFVCILPDTELAGALQVAEAIRLNVIALYLKSADPEPKPVTVSVGVATVKDAPCSANELLGQADAQLYRAKNSGRNRVSGILIGSDSALNK